MNNRCYRTDENGHLTMCTPAQDAIIKRDFLLVPVKRLAENLNMSHTRLKKRMAQLGLVIPAELAAKRKFENQMKAGVTPWNKGKKLPAHVYNAIKKSMFKKGHLPHNAIGFKDGDLSFRKDTKTGILYVYIRLTLGKWYPLHQYAWECAHGKVPKGYCISFKDGDSMNCTVENLELITRGNNMKRNSCSVRLTDSYIAQTLARKKGGVGLVDFELKETIMHNKPLIELKRKSLILKRTIDERQKAK